MYIKKVKKERIPSQRDKAIIAEFLDGKTLQAVGNKFGMSRQRVHQILLTNCIETRGKNITIPKEVLEDLYLHQRLPVVKICKLLKVSFETLVKNVALYGMPNGKERKKRAEIIKIPKDILEDLFIHQRIGVVKIASLLKVSQFTLRKNLNDYELTRTHLNNGKPKGSAKKINRDELYDLYIKKNHTRIQVAELLNCNIDVVSYWLNIYRVLKVPNISIGKLGQNNKRSLNKKSQA
jgi:hypothetical protein